jgi:hypothetical protein
MKVAVFATLVTAFSSGGMAQPARIWAQGNPTNDEQYALEVINRVRANPVAAADFYLGLASAKPIVQTVVSQQQGGAAGIRSRIAADVASYPNVNDGRTASPKGPLVLYPLFTTVASALPIPTSPVFYNTFGGQVTIVPTVVNGDTAPAISGPNATGGTASTLAGGFTATGAFTFGANIHQAHYYPGASLREGFLSRGSMGIATWLDDAVTLTRVGQGGSGFTIVRGKTRMVGISLGAGQGTSRVLSVFSTDQEAFASSDLPFGVKDTVFITGVVTEDKDRDGDYTPGEGLGGVTITPNTGEWLATTSASGGYAIPVRINSGSYTVTARFADGTEVAKTVNVGNDSVKLDFTVDLAVKPGQETVAGSTGETAFVNLSTRGVAGKGENALIGGFVITGTASKKVLIRGSANSLKAFGLTGVLRKPVLTLYNGTGTIIKQAKTQDLYDKNSGAVNPDVAAISASVGAFPLATVVFDGGRFIGDTVIAAELAPGAYTVSIAPDSDTIIYTVDQNGNPVTEEDIFNGFEPVKGTVATNGLVLLEIYDVEPSDTRSRFINLSSRGRIESGARQMIVGFVIRGTGTRQLLVRGIGPALKAFGVAGALDDSALEVFDKDAKSLRTNEDWSKATWTDQSVGVSARVGAFALSEISGDAVVLMNVVPGLYSAGVKSVSGAPGVGLAEIYQAP